MIIHVDSSIAQNLTTATRELAELTHSWGHDLHEITTDTVNAADAPRDNEKGIDPVALSALMLSIPSAALAVTDLVDRIQKRRRATDLIHRAQQLADQHINLTLETQDGPIELASLDPDQLLNLSATEQDPPT
ncbi:hypothetical protein [Actinocrispum wychmicini]|uniref:Uncharacterized protein n=1 Tax=Actinocrispum wychmicini TaxID=1213861 RepID=A0A4R2JYD3_9PSEU|nr:hypothetical protein [Actinocrispum wychmicini]TCO64242.1 hypothetical protein EV192_1016 [Actinocrispum wychmicini]